MKFNLEGKVALITGACGLLGGEHAEALLLIDADIILTDIDSDKLSNVHSNLSKKYSKRKIYKYLMDVSDENSILSVHQDLKSLGINVSVLINNAAIDPKVSENSDMLEHSRLENFSLTSWQQQVSVGLTGAFLCSKHFGSAMAAGGNGGVILNIASDLSVIAPDQRLYRKKELSESMQPVKPITYSVIKTGLIGLTRYLSTYWADKNIRVNSLSPGGVFNGQPLDFVEKLSHLIPMGRMASRNEYHGCIQFLCSDASSYITGQNIVSDGGRSVL
ncbi:MAG: SDR family oxidoreductase [Pseudobdellovibrionaceae bacterium]